MHEKGEVIEYREHFCGILLYNEVDVWGLGAGDVGIKKVGCDCCLNILKQLYKEDGKNLEGKRDGSWEDNFRSSTCQEAGRDGLWCAMRTRSADRSPLMESGREGKQGVLGRNASSLVDVMLRGRRPAFPVACFLSELQKGCQLEWKRRVWGSLRI